MKTKEIIDLIDFVSKSDINEVNIETPEFKVFIKKRPDVHVGVPDPSFLSSAHAQTTGHIPAGLPKGPENTETFKETRTDAGKKLKEIRSPMIGTFYQSPNPDSPPFIKVGDKVKTGQTVCIIEAMKLFNEIESEIAGTVVEVLVSNASPVEYEQPLFLIDPS
jgi:acetyl-CoA carboxylase biotin carboxyl carrier protein